MNVCFSNNILIPAVLAGNPIHIFLLYCLFQVDKFVKTFKVIGKVSYISWWTIL